MLPPPLRSPARRLAAVGLVAASIAVPAMGCGEKSEPPVTPPTTAVPTTTVPTATTPVPTTTAPATPTAPAP